MNKKLFEYSYTLRKQKQSKDIKILIAVIISVIFITIVMNLLIYPVIQTSNSMTPELPEDSFLVVTPIVKTPDRGDVIVIGQEKPADYSLLKRIANSFVVFFTARKVNLIEDNEFPNTKSKIRRVVGLPGDTIYMKDYKLFVKPQGQKHFLTEYELVDRQYSVNYGSADESWDNEIGISGNFDEIVVGPSEYFVLADNRNSAEDSRIWGSIHQTKIKGKVLMCVFPFKDAKMIY